MLQQMGLSRWAGRGMIVAWSRTKRGGQFLGIGAARITRGHLSRRQRPVIQPELVNRSNIVRIGPLRAPKETEACR